MYPHTCCSLDRVFRILEGLQSKQKATIEEIGFNGILQLGYIKIDHILCLWLINNFNPYSYILEAYTTCIKLLPNDVKFIYAWTQMGWNWYEQRYWW